MPYLGSTVLVSVVVLVCLLSLTGSWLVVRSLVPRFHRRAADACTEHIGLTTLLGLVVASGGVIVSGVLLGAGPGLAKALGTALAMLLGAAAIAGGAGLATRVGEGLRSASDAGSEWRQTLRGACVLVASFLTPVLGWLVLFPLALACGVGATVTGLASSFASIVAGDRASSRSPYPIVRSARRADAA